jgi:folylpolyglutamate synthase/dihydropteroate synthase
MTPAGEIPAALARAAAAARPGDRIVVMGSFHTVGPALASLGVPL